MTPFGRALLLAGLPERHAVFTHRQHISEIRRP